jgi:hypothetical protein
VSQVILQRVFDCVRGFWTWLGIDAATKETVRYRTTLANGFEGLKTRPLSTRTAIDICCTIKGISLDIPVLFLSRAIVRRKTDYYRLLLDVTANDAWEPWVLFMVEAVAETASWTSTKIRAIRELLDQTAATMREHAPRVYSRELAELIFSQPYCRIGNLVETGIAQRQSASVYLKTLVGIGLLEEHKSGRERLFVNPALLRHLMSDPDNPTERVYLTYFLLSIFRFVSAN